MDCVSSVWVAAKVIVKTTEAHQSQGGHTEAHDGSTVKRDVQRGGSAFLIGCDGGADISLCCGVHTKISRSGRGHSARDKSNRGVGAERREHNADDQHCGEGK